MFELDLSIRRLTRDVPEHPALVQLTGGLSQPVAALERDVIAGAQADADSHAVRSG